MNEIKILVVEDEPIIASDIISSLEELGYYAYDPASSAEEALLAIAKDKPDLILLDIAIEGDMDGIQLAEQIKNRYSIPFIFLTSYSDRSTIERVVQTEPAAYIVKPFDETDLQTNIELTLFKYSKETERGNKLQNPPHEVPLPGNHFFIKVKDRLTRLDVKDILWAEAYDNYTYLKTDSGKYLISSTLKSVESKIAAKGFVRTHRSYLANLNQISAILEDAVIIKNHQVPIGKKYKDNLKKSIALL